MLRFILVMAMALSAAADDIPAQFTVTVPGEKDTIQVEATYSVERPYLEIAEGAYSEGVEGGLAGYIENVSVTRADGTPLTVEGPQGGRWNIGARAGERLTIRYAVRLNYEQRRWPFGVDEIAYARDDGVFFVARTVLLMNDAIGAARVRFVVPDGWRVAAPWRPVDGEAHTYEVANRRHLAQSCILAGNFIERQILAGGTTVTLAMGNDLSAHVSTLDSSLRAVVPAYGELFQDSPQLRFLVVVNAHRSGGITDGSAYLNSVSMLTPRRMEGVNYDQAIYTIAHEILHLWNGNRMRPVTQLEWFREGFTDYVTWRTLAKLRLVNETAVLRELRRQTTAYLNQDRKVSIASAGDRKALNSVLVYEGGSLAALCIDSRIREHSEGKRSIADLMREIYARSAIQNVPYDRAMIVSCAGEMAGKNLQPFFERYIDGMEPVPLESCMATFGLRMESQAAGNRISVTLAPEESSKGQTAIARDAFLGRN